MTKWRKLACRRLLAGSKEAFERAYVTDATEADLELVAEVLEELPEKDRAP